jgi:carboxymethylenebutenolidase
MSAPANGFAAAVQPISDQTIHTSADGLVAGMIQIPVPDGQLPGYRAMPDSGGPFPIVLVMMEIFGLHEYIKDVCRRFAHEGYVAVAPDIFHRAGDPMTMTEIDQIRREVILPTQDSQVMTDLDAAAAWAAAVSQGDPLRLAITGFCWGGRMVWLYAAHNAALKAGVAWYGRLDSEHTTNQPCWPVDVAGELKAPVLGLYGGADAGIPLDQVARMQDGLKAASSPSEFVVYPDAPHGFHADYRPSYRPADARDGEQRMLEWFRKHGA